MSRLCIVVSWNSRAMVKLRLQFSYRNRERCHFTKLHSTTKFFRSKKAMRVMRFSYFGSGKFSAVDLVFYYYLAGVFDIDKTHLELTICPRHRDMFDGTKGFSTTGKLSLTKIPSSRLASPGSTRMGQKELCCLELMVFALQHSSQRKTRYYPVPDQAAHRFIVFNVSE